MADPTRPTQTSNLKEAARAQVAEVAVQLPAVVKSYDRTTQTATIGIVPCFRRKVADNKNEPECYTPPDIANVPVMFPGSGGVSMLWDLEVGSFGLAMFCDRAIDEWKSTGAARTEPQDPRRHDITDAVFMPEITAFSAPRPAAAYAADAVVLRGDDIRLGSSTASDPVALEPPVTTNMQVLEAAIDAAATAAIGAAVPMDGGVVAFTTFKSSLLAALALWPAAQASSKVTAE